MNYNAVMMGILLSLSTAVGLAQQPADDPIKTDAEKTSENEAEQTKTEQNEPTRRDSPPPPPSESGFKPSTEISDDAPVAFPVDI